MEIGSTAPPPKDAPSLYIPSNRIAKFPFFHTLPLTPESLDELVRLVGPEMLLNTTYDHGGRPYSDIEIEEHLRAVAIDIEVFMFAPGAISLIDGVREVRLEVSVSQPLARRLLALGWAIREQGHPFSVPLKIYLSNIYEDSREFDIRRDELRNYWMRRSPRVEDNQVRPLSSVTAHVTTTPGLLRIVYGENDDDIVNYYRYEYFNHFIADYLKPRLP